MDIVKINIGIMVPDSGHLRRVRGKNLTVNVPKKYNGKHGSRGYEGESSKHTQKIFLRDRFFNHSFSVLQCDAPYRGHPTNIFYKLANQGTRI